MASLSIQRHFGMQRGLSVSSMPRALAYSISVCRAASQRSALVNSCVDITAPLTAPSQLMTIRTWVIMSSALSCLAVRASAAANNLLLRSAWPRCLQAGRISPDNPDQQDCAYEAANQVTEPSSQDDPEVAQNGARNYRTDHAEHDIHDHSHVTLHELLSQPACKPADDDGCYPAHSSVTHGSSPQKGHVASGHVVPNERLTVDLYQRVPAAPPTRNTRNLL